MPLLSSIARRKKIDYFLAPIAKDARILEIGSGSNWVGDYLKSTGRTNFVGLDIVPPADVVGDIRQWRQLGLDMGSFDRIIAFEVVEHVDCFAECADLLKPGGRLLVTTPIPERDWIMKLFESVGLNQQRTSPHDHLVDLRTVKALDLIDYRRVKALSQWGVFEKRK